MDDNLRNKLRDLQEDVITMRTRVPAEISKLMEQHMEMLKMRRIEMETPEGTAPKRKLKLREIKRSENIDHTNLNETIFKLNARRDALEKAKEYIRNYTQDSS